MRNKIKRKNLISVFSYNLSITNWLIILNVIFFVLVLILLSFNNKIIDYIALKPENILQGKYLWTFFTHFFMHGSFFHLFFNMFSLFFIGNFVEKIIGRKRFLWFYLVAGLVAGFFFFILASLFGNNFQGLFGKIADSGVGASGAIFGLLGLLAILTPKARVYLIAGPLIAIIIQAILSAIFASNSLINILNFIISFYFFLSIISIFSFNPGIRRLALPLEMPFWLLPIIAIVPLTIISLFVSLPIGNTAHLGGLIAGIIYGSYLKNKYKRKVMMLNRMIRRW